MAESKFDSISGLFRISVPTSVQISLLFTSVATKHTKMLKIIKVRIGVHSVQHSRTYGCTLLTNKWSRIILQIE